MYSIIFSVGGKNWKVSKCPFYLCLSSQSESQWVLGQQLSHLNSSLHHLSGCSLFKQTVLEFWALLDLQGTAYMYLYLREKVDLKILILMPFQYIRLLSWFQTLLNTWQVSAHCKHVLQVYITTKRRVQLPETADFSIRNYITKGNYKLSLVALKNVLFLVRPHVYYQNLVNLFLIKRLNVCKYRKKFIDVLVPLSLPHKYGTFLEGSISFVLGFWSNPR